MSDMSTSGDNEDEVVDGNADKRKREAFIREDILSQERDIRKSADIYQLSKEW